MTAPIHPDAIKRHLASRIVELAQAVLPDGRLSGHEWIGHGPDGGKWGVVVKGRKIGMFQNFGAGQGGTSGLALIRDAMCGGDPKAAYAWALQWLGEENAARPPPKPRAGPPVPRSDGNSGKGTYLHARPFDWDAPHGLYLRGRGIDPALLASAPRCLRFHPRCWNSDVRDFLPAMLAPVIHAETRDYIGTHRTYLECEAGRWRKARVPQAKKMIGSPAGGVIPLLRGDSRKSLREAPAGDRALIGEGIENTLTVAQYCPDFRAIAAIAAGNLPAIRLPAAIGTVMLIRDADGMNLAVVRSRNAAILAWRAEGREYLEYRPPAGAKDANDGEHATA